MVRTQKNNEYGYCWVLHIVLLFSLNKSLSRITRLSVYTYVVVQCWNFQGTPKPFFHLISVCMKTLKYTEKTSRVELEHSSGDKNALQQNWIRSARKSDCEQFTARVCNISSMYLHTILQGVPLKSKYFQTFVTSNAKVFVSWCMYVGLLRAFFSNFLVWLD